jgi:hypothetical protein
MCSKKAPFEENLQKKCSLKSMKKILGYAISVPVLCFGAIGSFHLYKETGAWNETLRNVIITITAVSVEIAILFLIHSLASTKGKQNKITALLLVVTIPVSLIGQYSFLLKEASKKVEAVQMAQTNLTELDAQKAALQAEKAILLKTLESETASGYGPKSSALKAEINTLTAKLETMESRTESNQEKSLEKTELEALATEFNLDPKFFMKIMVGIFLTLANILGFWLVYLADLGKEKSLKELLDELQVNLSNSPTQGVKKKQPVRQPVRKKAEKTKKDLPKNVIPFPSSPA